MAPARAQSAVRSSGTGVGSNWWAALLDGPRSRSDRTSRLRSCTARAARLTSAAGKHRAARLLLDAALRARQAATSRGELLVVARALLRAVACARGDAPLQRSARERLALLLCQEGLASEAGLDALLARGGYSHRLASHCLRYEEEEAAPSAAGRAAAMAWHCLARPVPPPVPPPGGGARGGAFVACLEGEMQPRCSRDARCSRGATEMQPRYVRHNLRCISEMQLRCSRGEDHIALHRQALCPVEWWAGSQLHWARPPLSGPRTGTSATVCLRPSAAPLPHLSYLGCTSAAPRLYLDQSRLHLCRTATYAYDSPRHICLPISPHISPSLPISPHISPYLPISPAKGVRLASPFFSYVHSLRGRAPYCLNMYSTYSKRPPKGPYSARIRRIPTVFIGF